MTEELTVLVGGGQRRHDQSSAPSQAVGAVRQVEVGGRAVTEVHVWIALAVWQQTGISATTSHHTPEGLAQR